jgi:hypothetical protein
MPDGKQGLSLQNGSGYPRVAESIQPLEAVLACQTDSLHELLTEMQSIACETIGWSPIL